MIVFVIAGVLAPLTGSAVFYHDEARLSWWVAAPVGAVTGLCFYGAAFAIIVGIRHKLKRRNRRWVKLPGTPGSVS